VIIWKILASFDPTELTGVAGDAEKTKDRRQTCRKLGSDMLGCQMEMPNSLITSFSLLSLLLPCFFSSIRKNLSSFFYSLKPYFFSLFFKVSVL
jgi:hypothetical protein